MGKKSEYQIGFSGLLDGKHDFHYKIGNEFFEQFDYADIEGADLEVAVVLEKKPNMLLVEINLKGSLTVMCDRCTDSFELKVSGKDDVIYKFTDEELDDEKIICILPHEVEIDITLPIYEFASLLLPARRIHKKGDCNEEMLKEIDNYLMVKADSKKKSEPESPTEESEIDPRWSKLKDLKNKS